MTAALGRPGRFRPLAVVVGLIVVIAALHGAAMLDLRGPSDLSADGINAWMDDPVRVMATVARWVSLVLAYYLLVIVGATAVFGERLEETSWGRITPSAFAGLAGLLLGTSAVALPAIAHSHSIPSLQLQPDALVLEEVQMPLTLVQVETEDTAHSELEDEVTLQVEADSVVPEVVADSVWTVQRGDSFWSIAEETLSEDLSRDDLTDAEIAEYWRVLIAANESELVDPGNPDLILPGQVLVLPPN